MYRKNTASQYVYFCLVNATTGGALTGATVTAYRALDGGVQASATGTTTELANGQYRFSLSQADTNGNYGSFLFLATNAVPVEKTVVFTEANPQDGAAFGLSTINTIDSATDATIAVVNDLDTRIPAALVSGRIEASVGAMANNVLTASAIASDAITDAKVASDVTIASVTGAVGSVTNPVTLTVAYDAAKTASTQTSVDTLATYVDTEVAAIKAKTDNLPVDPADASDIAASFATVNSTLATIAGYIDTEVAAIKAKTDNLPIDPADASDIAASFASLTSLVNTLTGYVDTEVAAIKAKTDNLPAQPAAVSDIPTANQNRDALLNASPTGGWTNGSFGDRWLVSASAQRTVAVTGSNHIAADIHELQAGVITAGKFAAGAIDANALAADAATEIATAVASTQALTRLDSMIESDGAGQFRFDTIALSMGGGGGGGTVNIVVEDRSITVE
jgi:heme-degrading monooxygenase HmoA